MTNPTQPRAEMRSFRSSRSTRCVLAALSALGLTACFVDESVHAGRLPTAGTVPPPPTFAPPAPPPPAISSAPPAPLAPVSLAPVPLAPAPSAGPVPPDMCGACRLSDEHGQLANPSIDEASGLIASGRHAGIFYTHNDSGDVPRFFAIDRTGADRGTFPVQGALALDWEDIARGPCANGAGSCLYLGDLGDNLRLRQMTAIYRVPEPEEITPGEHPVKAEALLIRYPDGSHDAEALLVHPITGVITVVTKVKSGASGIYEVPRPVLVNQAMTLIKVGEVTPPSGSQRITAGDVHPRGEGVLLRTYDHVWFYAMRPAQTVAQALAGAPCAVPAAKEKQGESIAWEATGQGYASTSEGAGAPLSFVGCGGVLGTRR